MRLRPVKRVVSRQLVVVRIPSRCRQTGRESVEEFYLLVIVYSLSENEPLLWNPSHGTRRTFLNNNTSHAQRFLMAFLMKFGMVVEIIASPIRVIMEFNSSRNQDTPKRIPLHLCDGRRRHAQHGALGWVLLVDYSTGKTARAGRIAPRRAQRVLRTTGMSIPSGDSPARGERQHAVRYSNLKMRKLSCSASA